MNIRIQESVCEFCKSYPEEPRNLTERTPSLPKRNLHHLTRNWKHNIETNHNLQEGSFYNLEN